MTHSQARTLQLRASGTAFHQSFEVQDNEASFYKTVSPPIVLDEGTWVLTNFSVRMTSCVLDVMSKGTSGLRIYRDNARSDSLCDVTFAGIGGTSAVSFVEKLNVQLKEAAVPDAVRPKFAWFEDRAVAMALPRSQPGEAYCVELSPDLAYQLGFTGLRFRSTSTKKTSHNYVALEPFAPLIPLNSLYVCMPSTVESTTRVDDRFLPAVLRVDPEFIHDPAIGFQPVRLDAKDDAVSLEVTSRVVSFLHASIMTQSGRPLRFMIPPRYFNASFVLERRFRAMH